MRLRLSFGIPSGIVTLALVAALTPMHSSADPAIGAVVGNFANGSTLVIEGNGFSEKPQAKPLFWWTADVGDLPSALGRLAAWSAGFAGDRQQIVVAPGSQYSYRFDHAGSGAALGRVNFNSDRLYLWRKKYDHFDQTQDYAIRTRVSMTAGGFEVGQTVTGQTSGATGVIQSVSGPDSSGRWTVLYNRVGGTINNNPPTDFRYNETMVTATGSATNVEGSVTYPTGTFRTFNNKTLRAWSPNGNNSHTNGGHPDSYRFKVTPEFTQGSLFYNLTDFRQVPRQWNIEELIYEASAIGVANGRWWHSINNVLPYSDLIVTRNQERPSRYDHIFQSQVSNGAQPNSWVYYDALYIDESWHRVVVSSAPTWVTSRGGEVQIPVTWADGRIEIRARLGSLNTAALYLYVFDADGKVNQQGYTLACSGCPPAAPSQLVVN